MPGLERVRIDCSRLGDIETTAALLAIDFARLLSKEDRPQMMREAGLIAVHAPSLIHPAEPFKGAPDGRLL